MPVTNYYKEVEGFYEREESRRFYSLLVLYEKEINFCLGVAAQLQPLKDLLVSGNIISSTLIANYVDSNFSDLRLLLNRIVLMNDGNLIKNNDERLLKIQNWIRMDMILSEVSLAKQRLDHCIEEIKYEKNIQRVKAEEARMALCEFNSLFNIYHNEIQRCNGVLKEMKKIQSLLLSGGNLSQNIFFCYSKENLQKLREFLRSMDGFLNDSALVDSSEIISFKRWVSNDMNLSDISESEKNLYRSIDSANEQMKMARIFKKMGI